MRHAYCVSGPALALCRGAGTDYNTHDTPIGSYVWLLLFPARVTIVQQVYAKLRTLQPCLY